MKMETLFHYTTATGLLGILTGSSIWASDLMFLNDSQEAVYARDLVFGAIRDMQNPLPDPEHFTNRLGQGGAEHFAEYQRYVLDGLTTAEFGIFVTCFCESGDLLSQWRAYGSDHGYAIEISVDALHSAIKAVPTYAAATGLFKVRYGYETAETVIETAIAEVASFNGNHPGVKAHYAALAVSSMLAQVKHPGFSEEQEWRLVMGLEIYDESSVTRQQPTQFRATNVAIVPYLTLPLPLESIVSIKVGPGKNVEVRESGTRRVLKSLGSKATVTRSEVPLRT